MADINYNPLTYVENAVAIPSGSVLTANELMPTDAKAILIYGTVEQDPSVTGRACLFSWGGTGGGVHGTYVETTPGFRLYIKDTVSNAINLTHEPVPLGELYHFLISAHTDGSNILATGVIGRIDGTWETPVSDGQPSGAGATLVLGPGPLTIHRLSDQTKHNWGGTNKALNIWTSTTGAPIADVTDPDVQADFISYDKTLRVDGLITKYGTPLLNLRGTAEDLQAGDNTGGSLTLTKSGTPITVVEPPVDPEPGEAPSTIEDPEISGQIIVGSLVAGLHPTYIGEQPITTEAQWEVDGVVNSTQDQYLIGAADAAQELVFKSRGVNAIGTSDWYYSDPALVPAEVEPPDPVDPPVIVPGDFSFSVAATPGPSGDLLWFDPISVYRSGTWDEYAPAYFEWRIEDGAGGYVYGESLTAQVPVGWAKGYPSVIRGLPSQTNTIQFRQVDHKLNVLYLENLAGSAFPVVRVGDTVTHTYTGYTGIVEEVLYEASDGKLNTSYGNPRVIIKNSTGPFPIKGEIHPDDKGYVTIPDGSGGTTLIGSMSKQPVQPRYAPISSEIRATAWSTAVDITTSVGTPTVEVQTFTDDGTPGRTDFVEGEIVVVDIIAKGFNIPTTNGDLYARCHPMQYLHTRITATSAAGESRDFDYLDPAQPWDLDQSKGEGFQWAYRPVEDSGPVTFTVEVFSADDRANSVTETLVVNMTPKTATFDADNTYVVSTTDFVGAPPSNNQYSSLQTAIDAMRSSTDVATTQRRLCIHTDQSFPGVDMDFRNAAMKNLLIDNFGGGTNPILNDHIRVGNSDNVIIEGIRIDTGYDPVLPDNWVGPGQSADGIVCESAKYVSIYGCEVFGTRYCIEVAFEGCQTNIVNCGLGDFMEFAIYGPQCGAHFMSGNPDTNLDLIRSEGKKDDMQPYTANHSGYRASRCRGHRSWYNTFTTGAAQWGDGGQPQPIRRPFGSMPDYPYFVSMIKSYAVGNKFTTGASTTDSFTSMSTFLVDKLIVASFSSSPDVMPVSCGGLVMRNVLVVTPDLVNEYSGDVRMHLNVSLGNTGTKYRPDQASVICTSHSHINLKSLVKGSATSSRAWTFAEIQTSPDNGIPPMKYLGIDNILDHAPNYYTGAVDSGPLLESGPLPSYGPLYGGRLWYDFSVMEYDWLNIDFKPRNDQNIEVTQASSGASAFIKLSKSRKEDDGVQTVPAYFLCNMEGSGTFVATTPGDASTEGVYTYDGVEYRITILSWSQGTGQAVTPVAGTMHDNTACYFYQPLSGSDAYQGAEAGVHLPYDDCIDVERRRDGTGARGAFESEIV